VLLLALTLTASALLPLPGHAGAPADPTCGAQFRSGLGATLGASPELGQISRIDQVEDRLWAVNATNRPPADGLLKPRLVPEAMTPTTHFSIGQLVPPHENGSWESKRFAILVPVKELYPQAVNYMATDTFVMGELKLPETAVLVAPAGSTERIPVGKVFEYDPSTTTLRQAVENAITSRNGLVLSLRGAEGGEYNDYVSFKQLFAGAKYSWEVSSPSLNTADFFEPALRQHPWASFGTHNRSVVGQSGRLGQISYSLQMEWSGSNMPLENSVLNLATQRVNLRKLDEFYRSQPLAEPMRRGYEDYRREAAAMNDLLEECLRFRVSTGKNPIVENEILRKQLYEARSDAPKVRQLLEKQREGAPKSSTAGRSTRIHMDPLLQLDLLSLGPEDLDPLIGEIERIMPGLVADSGGPAFLKLNWALTRHDFLKHAYNSSLAAGQIEAQKLVETIRAQSKLAAAQIQAMAVGDAREDADFTLKVLMQNAPAESH
jgi:hypothetical protein